MSRRILAAFIALAAAACHLTGCVSAQPATVGVLTYNIHHGAGMDGAVDLERIANVIREARADLVALQEVDRGVERTGRVNQPERLAELTGMHVVFGKNLDLQGGEYGNAVLSRVPIEHHSNRHLPRLPSKNEQRGLLEAHVTVGRTSLVFVATHFDHQPDDTERLACVTTLRARLAKYAQKPAIVAGDLNALPDSRVIQKVASFLQDAGAIRKEPLFTYPADDPDRRIDYILYNDHPAIRCLDYRVLPDAVSSDHRPVLAVFALQAR